MSIGIVAQSSVSDTGGYGPNTTTLHNTTGNALIAFLAVGSDNVQGYLPRLAIADDAHNWWIYAGTSTAISAGTNRRVDIWVAPNARRADPFFGTNVSVSSSQLYAGLVGSIIEVSGFPQYAGIDFVQSGGGFGTSVTLSGTATVPDYVFTALLVAGPSSGAVTTPPGFTFLSNPFTTSGLTDMSALGLYPAYQTVSAGAVSAAWSWATNTNDVAVMVGFKQAPAAPVQPNPNWPVLKVEAAFGWSPGDLTGTMPTWTDITSRAQDEPGKAVMKTAAGRDFELSQPAAGSVDLVLDNHDSGLNPLNASGPYYPNVRPQVPVRVSAIWQGRQYGIGFSFANKWPQSFPDPQWGMVDYTGSDAIGIASQGQMPSAYGGQVLADNPYCYYPLGEYFQNAHGQLFANQSRTNLKPMVGFSPADLSPLLQTGLTLGMLGDAGAGIGVSGLTTPNTVGTGAGAFLRDVGMPDIGTNLPCTIELWAYSTYAGTLGMGTSGTQNPLLTLTALHTNYMNTGSAAAPGRRFYIYYASNGTAGNDRVGWQLTGPNGIAFGFNFNAALTSGTLYHIVFTITYNGTQYAVTQWMNGVKGATTNVPAASPLEITGMWAGTASPITGGGYNQNWVVSQVAIYPWALPDQRIFHHYITGAQANNGDTLLGRLGRLSAYSGLGLPVMGSPSPPSPLMGNLDRIQGSALADALYDVSVDEGGFYYAPADSTGCIWYASRTSLYNRTPKYIFGDNGTTEVPVDYGSDFDYSDSYLFNIVSSLRTISSATQYVTQNGQIQAATFNAYGVNAVVADQASEAQYMPRGPHPFPIETTSDQDAYDRANWSLVKYKQPMLRANQVRLHAASNPSIFATALAVQQGDVVTVNRRPIGGAVISLNCIVEKVEHNVGPDLWDTTLTLAPYFPENAVIQLDNASFDQLQDGVLGW